MSYEDIYGELPQPRPRVRFETIGEAWTLLQQQMGPWLGAGGIVLVCSAIPVGIGLTAFVLPILAALSRGGEPNPGNIFGGMFLGIFGLVVASLFLSGLVNAGFYRMALKQVRGREISVSDLLDIKDIFWPMLGMSLLVGLAVGIGMQLLYVPGYILGGLWMLAGPLIIERRMGALDAMGASWKALQSDLVMAACYYFVISLLSFLGALFLGIGVIFTLPLFYLCQALVYRDFFPDPVSEYSLDV